MTKVKSHDIGSFDEPQFGENYRVLQHVLLNCNNISGNNNKFYSLELQESDGQLRIFTHYGRVGLEGVKEGRYFLKRDFSAEDGKSVLDCLKEAAETEFQRILNSKKKKGYVPVDVTLSLVGSGRVESKAAEIKTSKSSLDARVQSLVLQIYEESSKTLESSIQTPLGALSESQINKGYDKLEEIKRERARGNITKLVRLSSDFYSLIPQRFSHRIESDAVIDSDEKICKQEELLQLMRDVYCVRGFLGSDIDVKYKGIKAVVEPLKKGDSEYQRLEDKVFSTHSPNHNVRLFVNNIFKINLLSVQSRFNPQKLETQELFHGSANKNILGILQRGLLIAPACASFNGAAFGRGIYFARHSTKSSQYSTKFHRNIHSNGFLFIADVALGKMQKVTSYTYSNSLRSGFDSVYAQTGNDLIHDEYIVYNPNQVELNYLIEFTPRSN